MGTAYLSFTSTLLALIVAIAFWLTGSDFDLVLFCLACVAGTGAVVLIADRLTRKYKDD